MLTHKPRQPRLQVKPALYKNVENGEMRTQITALAILVSIAFTGLCAAGSDPAVNISPKRILEFNRQVDQAASDGEAWPCSPLLVTCELLGKRTLGLAAGRELFCRGAVGDSFVTVAFRDTASSEAPASDWFGVRCRKLDDSTWRLVGVELVGAASSSIREQPIQYILGKEAPEGARRVHSSDLPVDLTTNNQVVYSGTHENVDVAIVGIGLRPFWCVQPDSTVPVAVVSFPSPHSVPIAEFAVLAESDIKIQVLNRDRVEVASVDLDNVVAGPYRVQLGGEGLAFGVYYLQVWYSGRTMGVELTAFYGSTVK